MKEGDKIICSVYFVSAYKIGFSVGEEYTIFDMDCINDKHSSNTICIKRSENVSYTCTPQELVNYFITYQESLRRKAARILNKLDGVK